MNEGTKLNWTLNYSPDSPYILPSIEGSS